MNKLQKLIFAALLSALTFVTTYVIKIPTPTMGYIHPGDAVVLLSGFLLGPLYGGFAAGFGSMLSDLLGGYISYAPGTFLIKFFTAVLAAFLYEETQKILKSDQKTISTVIAGTIAELFMVLGYFIFEIFLLGIVTDGLSSASISAGIVASAAGVPFNVVQGIFAVIIATILHPILKKVLRQTKQFTFSIKKTLAADYSATRVFNTSYSN